MYINTKLSQKITCLSPNSCRAGKFYADFTINCILKTKTNLLNISNYAKLCCQLTSNNIVINSLMSS